MADQEPTRVEFVDALLRALGLASITTEPLDSGAGAGQHTGFHGRSYFSSQNRDLVTAALDRDPRPTTLTELADALAGLPRGNDSELLEALLTIAAKRGSTTLVDFATKPPT